jgi:hypothetical protein
MSDKNLILLAAAGVAVFLLWRHQQAKQAADQSKAPVPSDPTQWLGVGWPRGLA